MQRALVVALAWFALSTAQASLEASLGAAAVSSALKQANTATDPSVVRAANGPPSTLLIDDSSGQTVQDMAVAARDYLQTVFQNQPDALQRVQTAYEHEASKGMMDAWKYADEVPAMRRAATGAAGMHSGSGSDASCGVCQDLNALYEADLPQFQSRMEELVLSRGYPLERHTVVTPDGYELVLFRIPHGAQRHTQPGARPVVLLHHGITMSSDSFVLYGRDQSLGFILADAGFDVWIANQRGNTYSRRNVNGLYPYQPEFWHFSIDTLAQLDLPTQVDYVLQTTGASKIGYVGHSQGCLLVNLLCSSKPEYNSKFSVLAEMAPVFFVQYMQQPYLRVGASLRFDEMLYLLRIGEFLPNRLTAPLLGTLCTGWPLDEVCAAAISFFFFGPALKVRAQDYKEISRVWPSSVCSRNMVHWSQNLRAADNEFRYYNYGLNCNSTGLTGLLRGIIPGAAFRESCNQLQYGTNRPPAYDLSRVTAPTVYFLGGKDSMSRPPDVAEQQRRIGAADKGQFVYPSYGHMDFVWDRGVAASSDIIETLYKYAP